MSAATMNTQQMASEPLPASETLALAPCPFCGGEAYLLTGHGGCQFGKCKACGAEGARAWRRGWSCEEEFEVVREERKRDAAEKWNRRANAKLSD